jgi:hypothetical protein
LEEKNAIFWFLTYWFEEGWGGVGCQRNLLIFFSEDSLNSMFINRDSLLLFQNITKAQKKHIAPTHRSYTSPLYLIEGIHKRYCELFIGVRIYISRISKV